MSPSAADSQALPAGTRLEEFEIGKVLGSGGFGVTYLARDTKLGRRVVVKENLPVQFCFRDPGTLTVLPRHSVGADAESFAWSLENFSQEAALLASLDHPGIVRVLRSLDAFGTAYFVMPFVEGQSLDILIADRSKKGVGFSEEELSGLTERVLEALGHLHDRGIYHRDIKPGNILITREGLPVLIDFGSARQRLGERSMTVIESAGYTPFEQLQSRGNVGPWSDLYALGGTLAKAVTGETPPKAMDRMRNDPWRPLADCRELAGCYSPWFLAGIDRALLVEEADRWQSAGEWRDGLREESPPIATIATIAAIAASCAVEWADCLWEEPCPPPEPEPEPYTDGTFTNSIGMTMIRVPGKDAWLAKTQSTQVQYEAVTGMNPSEFRGSERPVETVSWDDAVGFCQWLTERERAAGKLPEGFVYALPPEVLWEHACRAGTTGDYAHPVATKRANAWGFHDMHGNVSEWCADWYDDKRNGRICRGGGWRETAEFCSSGFRGLELPSSRSPFVGFRPALVPEWWIAPAPAPVPERIAPAPAPVPVPHSPEPTSRQIWSNIVAVVFGLLAVILLVMAFRLDVLFLVWLALGSMWLSMCALDDFEFR